MKLQTANRFSCEGQEGSLGDLPALFAAAAHRAGAGASDRLAVISDDPRMLVASAVGLHAWSADGAIVAATAASPAVRSLLLERGYSLLEIGPSGEWARLQRTSGGGAQGGRIALLTSGTTGTPKLLTHTWESLATLRAAGTLPPHRWLLTYLPGTYAWFQMLTLSMFGAEQALVASPHCSPEEIWDNGLAAGFDAVSSTPTFWRYLLALRRAADLVRVPLAQITLGGEPVRQDLLDRLRALFPAARLTHIYAAAEVGAAIVVHDGREGFPRGWLADGGPGRCRIREAGGILEVQSPYAAEGTGSKDLWHSTGDRVEIRGNRAVITGRAADDVLNVGGRKASAVAIEEVLRANPLLSWCRVRGARAPLVGTLVAADVVLAEAGRSVTREEAERELTAFCVAHGLPEWMVPRLWTFLDRVPVSPAFKVERLHG